MAEFFPSRFSWGRNVITGYSSARERTISSVRSVLPLETTRTCLRTNPWSFCVKMVRMLLSMICSSLYAHMPIENSMSSAGADGCSVVIV